MFADFAKGSLEEARARPIFKRLLQRSQIDHRWSILAPTADLGSGTLDTEGLYRRGAFPSTAARMRLYERFAPCLAAQAVAGLRLRDQASEVSHVLLVSCTGLSAPGVDLQLVQRCGLNSSVERTVVGFMGCYAAINALRLARHIVRSEPAALVLIVSVELCTLHLQETTDLEKILSFLVFGDGAAAALISSQPSGFSLDSFHAVLAPEAVEQITWTVGDEGFEMFLSGRVPGSVAAALRTGQEAVMGGRRVEEVELWAVHPGGRSVLDAVEDALSLEPSALAASREVLRRYGNMSSATILFVLAALMERARQGERGCAMAFGPGLTAETMLFTAVGH
jgi:predicted naringenin-chalcone synthase